MVERVRKSRSLFPINSNVILLLDDEFDLVTSLKQLLERKGFHVFGFTDALLALEHFQINHDKYGLVISDLRMPGMNGYEFIKKSQGNKIRSKSNLFDGQHPFTGGAFLGNATQPSAIAQHPRQPQSGQPAHPDRPVATACRSPRQVSRH